MDWHLPLVITAGVFVVYMLWRMRPAMPPSRDGSAPALREAKQRILASKDDKTRALALADAGDACARSVGRATGAVGYYLRALRADPSSEELVGRAAQALARRPRALEALLWRHLSHEPWTGARQPAARAAVRELARLYEGPLRNRVRARAMEHALGTMGSG